MNARIALTLAALLLAGLGCGGPATAQTKGLLKLPDFAGLVDKANESVTVRLDPQLLGLACRFLSSDDPEQAEAKQFCTSLQGIYVHKFTFDTDYAYPKSEVDGVLKQLAAPGWSQIVTARSRKDQTDVDVFVLIDGDKARGLAIIAREPREFAIVNIVGNIDLEKLHELEGKFGVPNLEIETDNKSAAKEKSPAPKK